MKKWLFLGILFSLAFLLVACGGAAEPAANDANGAPVAEEANGGSGNEAAVETMAEENADEGAQAAGSVSRPDWHFVSFTDVRNGETLTFADLEGKTVFVEPMATWCSNCRRQLGNVAEAQAQLAGNEDIVFVALSVEPNIDDARLLEYANNEGFNWTFAKASPELLQGMVDAFGRTVTNPPSTPHFTIWPDGSMTDLSTGFESAEELVRGLQG